jgi:hypothetical protein
MRRRALHTLYAAAIVAVLALAATTSTAAAAQAVVNEHTGPVYDSFPDELCGFTGTSDTRFVGNFKLYDDGTYLSTGNFTQDFTAGSTGKTVIITGVEQVTGPFDPTDNGDGTITETFTFKGTPQKVRVANGPTLVRDAGDNTVAITFALNPDGSRGDVISDTVLFEHGPHPQLDDDAVFCNAVDAALA